MQTAAVSRTRNRTARTLFAGAAALALAACADAPAGVTAPGEEPAGPPGEATSSVAYTAVAGDDWKAYASKADLRAAGKFWWFRSEDVYDHVDLVQDATFGQVARIKFQQSSDIGWAPSIDESFAPLDRMWYRYRMKYHPGWTTVGPNPSGHANAYKVAFWLWEGYSGRGQLEISNTDEYILGFGVNDNGTYLKYSERLLPGSTSLGRVTTEWSDSEWWEFVAYYEKTGATSARQHWWKRRLTNGGAIANNAWTYVGLEVTGATTPRVRGITLGANKNKSNPGTMYIYWGPYEIVDGSRYANPWNMPNVAGATTAPAPATLTRVTVSPDTATVAPSATRQFTAAGTYSDGTSTPLSVTWSATGGSVTTGGLYTAPSASGTYRVIGRDAGTGLADTSTVTVPAAAPTLTGLVLTPSTASVQAGGTLQFTATGTYSDGSSEAVASTWSATGGTVSSGGLYTAGSTEGTFRVIAVAQGSTRADTAAVTVTAPPSGCENGKSRKCRVN